MTHRSLGVLAKLLWACGLIMVVALVIHFARMESVGATSSPALQAKPYSFDSQGRLIRPVGYRQWVYVGTPLTPNSLNPPEAAFPEFHNVYIDPVSYVHYAETGKFREGTILVKELVSVGSEDEVSGKGYFMGDFVGLEATIKDSDRFPNEPANWAYFSFGHSYPLAEAAEAFPAGACNACHEASAKDDWVFTQYYPVLRAAKGMTTSAASAEPMTSDSEEFQEMASVMTGALAAGLEPTADTATVDSLVPTDSGALHRFLKAGGYKDFPAQESASHSSRGPHSTVGWPVKVFMDAKTDAALKAGEAFPAGSSLVKEMYTEAGVLQGWAVMVKTQADSAGGQGWFWYESTNVDDSSDIVAAGNGVPLCFGCHSIGHDFVLTDYPLK